MRVLLAALMLVALAAPAIAQTTAVPISGDYNEVYVVMGRIVDSAGRPVSGGRLLVEIDQERVQAAPLAATANCKGDFITAFNLVHVLPTGKVKVTLVDNAGAPVASTTVPLDPFYRRSDAIVRMPTPWGGTCTQEADVWNVSASVSARLLDRTDPYQEGDVTYHARPFTGIVTMRFEPPSGNRICPPHPQDPTPGACETFAPDERGDLRYTFTVDQPFEAGGSVTLNLFRNQTAYLADEPTATERIEIDRGTRIGVKMIEVSGRGPPPELYETPGLGIGLVLALALALALALRKR